MLTGERVLRILKMGGITLSRPFPVLNYQPMAARLFQLPDRRWRITVVCEVSEDRPPVAQPAVIGLDRNVDNNATPDCPIKVGALPHSTQTPNASLSRCSSRRLVLVASAHTPHNVRYGRDCLPHRVHFMPGRRGG